MTVEAAARSSPSPDGLPHRASAMMMRITFSPWFPLTVAVIATLLILTGAGSALVQTRLAEIAEITPRIVARDVVPAGLPGSLVDLTVAPEDVRPISMDAARAWNASIPFSDLPILAARPFIMPPDRIADYARALDCLTAAIYYEAASESALGQAAVAQVVINRVRHPAFPKTVCGVVFQGQERTTGCQFSFTCDGAMARPPSASGWARARAVAASALNGRVVPEVGMATHYHTDWVAPFWAERLVKLRQIDTHIFYRWTGAWGLPGAFSGTHAGTEPAIEKLAALATYVEELPTPVTVADVVLEDVAAPVLTLMPPAATEPNLELGTGYADARSEIEQGVEQAATAAPAPQPAVVTNPLAPTVTAPQRRSRIAAPR